MTTAVAVPPASPRRRTYPTGWWGMVVLIMTEAMIFAGLLSSYFFVRAISPEWPLGHIEPPELKRISLFTVVLLGSSVPIFWAESAIRKGNQRGLRLGLLLSFLLGAIFMANLFFEYEELHFGVRDNAYASLYYAITGLHGLHVFVGLVMNLVVQIKAWQGKFTASRHLTVEIFGLYWHFVDVVWIFVFSSLYVSVGHW
ncbi:MAG TPA: cytochrome c oxidase subunit 3 [Acidimicrobiales bacterium]|nr:cytochrome c oxidase subunit 3 [Acidimicrobiales bacterium]